MRKPLALLSFLAVMVSSVHAQQPAFRAGVEVITVPVTVTSLDRNTYIAGLTPADFKVTENGDRQEVTSVARERVPLSLAIVIDSGTIMSTGNRRQLAQEAVDKVVAQLSPDDEVAILFLSRGVEQRLPWTRVRDIPALNWGGWNPMGTASLHDGIRTAFTSLQEARNGRHAILLLTPGFESSSRMPLSGLVKSRRESETSLFAFGLGPHRAEEVAAEQQSVSVDTPRTSDAVRGLDREGPNVVAPKPLMQVDHLDTLVGDSGGAVTRMLTMNEAAMAARNLVAELHNQYWVGYTPKKAFDGTYRKIKIEVNRKGLYVRHRAGYLALAGATAQ